MRKYTSRTHGSDYSINSKYHINNNVNSLIFYLSFERRSSIFFQHYSIFEEEIMVLDVTKYVIRRINGIVHLSKKKNTCIKKIN